MSHSAPVVPPASELDLLPTEDEEHLRATVAKLLEARCPVDRVQAAYAGDTSLGVELWKALVEEIDVAGLLVPEDHGGAGGSARDAAVVLRELGRALAPVPFLTSSVVATRAALAAADPDLLSSLAAGTVAALAVPQTASASSWGTSIIDSDGLRGRLAVVAGALEATLLLVPVRVGERTALRVVEADAPGVTLTPVVSFDMTRQVADIELDGAASRKITDDGARAVSDALALGAALVCSEQVGVAERCLADTVAYVSQRRQFGRLLGSFQALKHRLAEVAIRVDSAGAAAAYATAAAATDDPDAATATAVARIHCAQAAVLAAEEAVQLHGGIGMTWEHPTHLYLKRAKAGELTFGTPSSHRADLARLVDLPAPGT